MSETLESPGTVRPDVPGGRRGFLGRLIGAIAGGLLLAKASSASAQVKQVTNPAPRPAGTEGALSTLDADPWLGEIALVPFNYAPLGWAFCNGQLLAISQNATLFSLIGTTYGGDGISTFGLPDLRGRAPIHQGQGAGLTLRAVGQFAGEESHLLLQSEMPRHGHALMADSGIGSSDNPANATPAKNAGGIPQYSANPVTPMNANTVGLTGGGGAHNNMPPFLVMNYIIALVGTFPSRT
jgi:microcystin-dependent protein